MSTATAAAGPDSGPGRHGGRARLVVLVSGAGSNLGALLAACADPAYGADVVAVGSDRRGIPALEIAAGAGVPTSVLRLADYPTRADWDAALSDAVAAYRPDLVVLAGFMKLTGPAFLARFAGRTVNTHPALLPSFPGAHGVRDALAAGVSTSGATLFLIDEGVDTGPVLAQVEVPVVSGDDEPTLHERIKVAERQMLVETVGQMVREGFTVTGREVRIGMAAATQDASAGPSPAAGTGSAARPEQTPVAPQEASAAGREPIRRALLSVHDKAGLEELAAGLSAAGVAIVSTGATAARIAAAGVPVTSVEALTGFAECLDGRVKTLHPAVHAGLLADRRLSSHRDQLAGLGIEAFDLVVSNLYPFTETVMSGAAPDDCIEQIDIGGPAMVRSAAKNHANVAVVVDPARYPDVLAAVAAGGFTLAQRQRLAAEAFTHTATYDVHVASWLGNVVAATDDGTGFPSWVGATWERATALRYGENPHQRAAVYRSGFAPSPGLAQAQQLHGKEMSYNNFVDADAARRAAYDHDQPAVAIIKHLNPCGIAVGADIAAAHRQAHACDPVSAFGGVVAANRPVTGQLAAQLADIFTEVVVAPHFEAAALETLRQKKSVRLLRVAAPGRGGVELRPISGGLLMQTADAIDAPGDDPASWTLVAGEAVESMVLDDLAFAWRACRSVRSNAVLLATAGATVGIGMGQVNRVDAARLAVARAGERAAGAVAASDAFFPFADGLDVLLAAGVRAVVQPGGSIRDEEVIAAAERAGVPMYLTGARHFAH